MDKSLAGLLLSGILSDTLIFRSPTTSPKDRKVAVSLQSISGLDPIDWGKKIFARAMPVDISNEEMVKSDLKEYSSRDLHFAISQIETIDLSGLEGRKADLLSVMQEICQEKSYAFMLLMLTDILEEASELLIAGKERSLMDELFGAAPGQESTHLKGVLSRKKQVLPAVFEILRKKELMG